LDALLKLFAPFLPFVTEEVWSWWQEGTIHRCQWPSSGAISILAGNGDAAMVADVSEALSQIRKSKSDAKVSMRAVIESAIISASEDQNKRLQLAAKDLSLAGSIQSLTFTPGANIEVTVVLAPSEE
jgi:valyl-tRNA synthetase